MEPMRSFINPRVAPLADIHSLHVRYQQFFQYSFILNTLVHGFLNGVVFFILVPGRLAFITNSVLRSFWYTRASENYSMDLHPCNGKNGSNTNEYK